MAASAGLELEHSIGFSGGAKGALHVHPDGQNVVYAQGGWHGVVVMGCGLGLAALAVFLAGARRMVRA